MLNHISYYKNIQYKERIISRTTLSLVNMAGTNYTGANSFGAPIKKKQNKTMTRLIKHMLSQKITDITITPITIR